MLVLGSLLLTAAACSDQSIIEVDAGQAFVDGPVEVTLEPGQEKRVAGTVVRVGFVRVVGDSRCPVDVTCVWEGNAEVEVGLSVGTGPTVALRLNTSLEPRTQTRNGLKLSIADLLPRPRSDTPIVAKDYVLVLKVDAA